MKCVCISVSIFCLSVKTGMNDSVYGALFSVVYKCEKSVCKRTSFFLFSSSGKKNIVNLSKSFFFSAL